MPLGNKINFQTNNMVYIAKNYIYNNESKLEPMRINGGSVKYIHTALPSNPISKFSMPPNGTIANYVKPKVNSMYTTNEQRQKRLKYKFIGIYISYPNTSLDKIFVYAELYVPTARENPIEIYNVYTHPDYRRRGYAKTLLNLIKVLYPKRNLWLGVTRDQTNTNSTRFKSKIKLYAKLRKYTFW